MRVAWLTGNERPDRCVSRSATWQWFGVRAGSIGGTSAVIRKDTGDLLLVVPAGTYALVLRSLTFREETIGILRLLPA